MDVDKQAQWNEELQTKRLNAAEALEALDRHICDLINTLPYRNGLNSANNRLSTAIHVFREASELLAYFKQES